MPRPKKSDQSRQHTKRMTGARKKKERSDAKKTGAAMGKLLKGPLAKAAKKRAGLKMKKRGLVSSENKEHAGWRG